MYRMMWAAVRGQELRRTHKTFGRHHDESLCFCPCPSAARMRFSAVDYVNTDFGI